MNVNSSKQGQLKESIKAIAFHGGCSILLLTAGMTAGQAHTEAIGHTDEQEDIHYSHSFGYSNQKTDPTTNSFNQPVTATFRVKKGSSTKQLNAELRLKNHTNETIILQRVNIIRVSNSNLPSRITLKPEEAKTISIRGSVNSSNGRTALGVAYVTPGGDYISAMRHININNAEIEQINMKDIWNRGTPTVQPTTRAVPRISGSIKNFGKYKGSKRKPSNKMRSTKASKKASLFDFKQLDISSVDGKSLYQTLRSYISSTSNSLTASLVGLFTQPAYAAEGVVRGSVVFKSMNTHRGRDLFLPYTGLRVVAIKESQNCNTNRPIASTTVNGEGNYALRVNTSEAKYRLCFRTTNNYVHLTGVINQRTPWGWKTNLLNSGRNYTANFVDDFQPGVGDNWYTAMYYKTRVNDIGIDPVRSGRNKIQVVYPSDQCWQDVDEDGRIDRNAGVDVPWSCASRSGRISIKADHAAPGGVVIHEFAHQLDFKFGGNLTRSRGTGVGGNHSTRECTNPNSKKGMILTEGFANFEVARATSNGRSSDRYTNSWRPDLQGQTIYRGQLENPSACSQRVTRILRNGNHNFSENVPASNPGLNTMEKGAWAVMWDFYDFKSDGSDRIGYVSPAYLTYTYLNNRWDGLQGLLSRVYRDCRGTNNSNVTNNGAVCREIFAQNYSSDTANQSAN